MDPENRAGSHGKDAEPRTPPISHLKRREIQAPIAACLIRAFAGVTGIEKAMEVAGGAIEADAASAGRAVAERSGGNGMAELGRVVREIWSEEGALVIRILEETERRLSFDVTRCRYAELYEEMGMRDFGFCLSCNRDEAFARGFNPRIRLTRTRTIMQGAPVCDFRFTLGE